MIPIKNKKKNLKVTVEEMRNFSFNYIEKYAPSKQQLRTYLLKKYIKSKIPNTNKKNLTDLIDAVLQDLEKLMFINDEFYSYSKAKSLIRQGSSINKIRKYLLSKGINNKYIDNTINKIAELLKKPQTVELSEKTIQKLKESGVIIRFLTRGKE